MEIKVHDIVEFESIESLEKTIRFPEWIKSVPASQNFGVVRRMPIMNHIVPIGLRGETREQRFGTFIHASKILQVITPESLVDCIDEFKERIYFSAFKRIKEEFAKLQLRWGPTGSVGFELATSITVTTSSSDIDICIYLEQIDKELLTEVNTFLETLDKRIDVQVEISSIGAFLLKDFLMHENIGFLLRTPFGPQLCTTVNNQIKLIAK